MIDLRPDHLEIVKSILRKHAPGAEARAFGSRVEMTSGVSSDLDLAIVADKKLSLTTLAALETAFEESDLPFRVDVLDWLSISDEFRKKIESKYVVVK